MSIEEGKNGSTLKLEGRDLQNEICKGFHLGEMLSQEQEEYVVWLEEVLTPELYLDLEALSRFPSSSSGSLERRDTYRMTGQYSFRLGCRVLEDVCSGEYPEDIKEISAGILCSHDWLLKKKEPKRKREDNGEDDKDLYNPHLYIRGLVHASKFNSSAKELLSCTIQENIDELNRKEDSRKSEETVEVSKRLAWIESFEEICTLLSPEEDKELYQYVIKKLTLNFIEDKKSNSFYFQKLGETGERILLSMLSQYKRMEIEEGLLDNDFIKYMIEKLLNGIHSKSKCAKVLGEILDQNYIGLEIDLYDDILLDLAKENTLWGNDPEVSRVLKRESNTQLFKDKRKLFKKITERVINDGRNMEYIKDCVLTSEVLKNEPELFESGVSAIIKNFATRQKGSGEILTEKVFTYELWTNRKGIYKKKFEKMLGNLGNSDVIFFNKGWDFLAKIITIGERKNNKVVWELYKYQIDTVLRKGKKSNRAYSSAKHIIKRILDIQQKEILNERISPSMKKFLLERQGYTLEEGAKFSNAYKQTE